MASPGSAGILGNKDKKICSPILTKENNRLKFHELHRKTVNRSLTMIYSNK